MSYATYFTPLLKKVKGANAKNASPSGEASRAFRKGLSAHRRLPQKGEAFVLPVLPVYPFTASNSAQISSSGLAVQRLTATMTSAEITKAGSSS